MSDHVSLIKRKFDYVAFVQHHLGHIRVRLPARQVHIYYPPSDTVNFFVLLARLPAA